MLISFLRRFLQTMAQLQSMGQLSNFRQSSAPAATTTTTSSTSGSPLVSPHSSSTPALTTSPVALPSPVCEHNEISCRREAIRDCKKLSCDHVCEHKELFWGGVLYANTMKYCER